MCGNNSAHSRDLHENFNAFKNICIAQGFTQRGKAFFRILGDGVLQVLKYTYEFRLPHYEISVGLFSMYGELREQWFTASGCIPRYSVVNLIGEAGVIRGDAVNSDGIYIPYQKRLISIEDQITILENKGIPILNKLLTQELLVKAICALDIARSNQILWNDSLKYEPFLRAGDYEKASNVVIAILAQHNSALDSYRRTLSEPEYQKRYAEIQEIDVEYLEKLRIAKEVDEQAAIAYTSKNYFNNLIPAKFIRPYP